MVPGFHVGLEFELPFFLRFVSASWRWVAFTLRAGGQGSRVLHESTMVLIASLIAREKERDAEATAFLKEQPKFDIEGWSKLQYNWYPSDLERAVGFLQKAGLPE